MAKSPTETSAPETSALPETPALVSVRLKCFYAGYPGEPGPGAVIAVNAEEADRLVSLGSAEKL